MALTRRHQKKSPSLLPTTGQCTRSSVRLRGAPAAKIRAQASFNHMPLRRKGTSVIAPKHLSNKSDVSYRHPVHRVASPQRSSLRRALRESLELSVGMIASPVPSTITSSPTDSVQIELQIPAEESDCRIRGVQRGIGTATTTRPSKIPHVPALELKSQRSSLRRAIRESINEKDARYKNLVPPSHYPKLDPAQSSVLSLGPVEKPNVETRYRAVGMRDARRLSSNSKGGAVLSAKPRRSSLRRAVHESLRAIVQSNTFVDTASDEKSSGHNVILESTIGESLPNLGGKNGAAISLSDSSPATSSDTPLTSTEGGYIVETPSRLSRTSSISLFTASPSPSTPMIPSPLATLQPRKGLIPELSLVTESPISQSSPSPSKPSPSKPSSYLVSARELRGKSDSPTNVETGRATPADRNIVDDGKLRSDPSDSQSFSMRKGCWHEVREIINEVPSGLYLVVWEGRNPRTGVKWPASWVKAKNVSVSAIRDWEQRKHQMLSR